ncbi:hypothetical protein SteCoe_14040 [Stentor coeruleus]|uniref:Uncharacterized protein n=1 Tax=Stentor coeruleus TaxID=5963 RepID=A0A1R2C779_9CILI|nr:hypothetical protein SteCoe_14040 [Stentor coeruleus]
MQCIRKLRNKSKKASKYFISLTPIKSSYLPQISMPSVEEDKSLSLQYRPNKKVIISKPQEQKITHKKSPVQKEFLSEFYEIRYRNTMQDSNKEFTASSVEVNHLPFTEKNSRNCIVF